MNTMRFNTTIALVAGCALLGAVACGGGEQATNGAKNAPAPGQAATPTTNGNSNAKPGEGDTAKLAPTILKKEAGPDNSTIVVKQVNGGMQVEVRTWTAGPVEKVTRQSNLQKKTILRVRMRDGSRFRLDDATAVEHALDWTGEQIADAAKRLGKPMAAKEAADADDADDDAGGKKPADTNAKKPS
jgi:hypothetical protein